jgi:FkbM family methyltransferase
MTNEIKKRNIKDSVRDYYNAYREWRKARRRKAKYERDFRKRLKFYSRFIKNGDLCFDIGANMGNRTEVFLALNATVVAVEPQEECLRILRDRYKDNPRLILIDKGLDKIEGERKLFVSNANTLSTMSDEWINLGEKGRLFEGSTWSKKTIVRTTTLDALIKTYGVPAFCKIDVEGFEYSVLRGLSKPVNVISFEFVPEFVESAVNCIRYIAKLGEAEYNYSEGESMRLTLSNWVYQENIIKILKNLPRGKGIFGDVYARFSMK